MFYFDPTFLLLIPAIILGFWAQHRVTATFEKYDQVLSSKNVSGEEVARMILNRNGLSDIEVLPVPGNLTDHYSPSDKKIFLSNDVYNNTSISAIAVAAHEVGHAIQDKEAYSFMRIRDQIVPAVNFSSQMVWIIIMAGIFLSMPQLIKIGIVLFTVCVLFQIITLPVEFDASSRALKILESDFLVKDENIYAKRVLRAAALTYVVAALASVLQLVRLLLLNRSRD